MAEDTDQGVNDMKVSSMTEQQCRRIIANSYLGEHDKRGRQVDYSYYSEEIDQHLWSLQDAKLNRSLKAQMEHIDDNLINPTAQEFKSPRIVANERWQGFKLGIRWDLIAINCNLLTKGDL
jgi:hypothetical protein